MSAKSSGLLVLAVVAACGYGVGRPPATDAAPRVSAGFAHDNLTVFLVRGPDTFDAKNVLTLGEALAQGVAVVHETGTVNELAVENLSVSCDIFLQSGDIVKGGKQDRLIAKDILLSPKSGKVACPSHCCEQSRWTARGNEAVGQFAASTDFAVGNPIKAANFSGDQGRVWQEVQVAQKKLSDNLGKAVTANASPTSLQLALEDNDVRARVAAYETALGRLADAHPDAVGVVVAVNGKVIAADVYGSASLFRKVWPKLLRSAAADAVAQLPPAGAKVPHAAAKDAVAFLAGQADDAAPATPAALACPTPEPVDVARRLREPAVNPTRAVNDSVRLWAATGAEPRPVPRQEAANGNPPAAGYTRVLQQDEPQQRAEVERLANAIRDNDNVTRPQPAPQAGGVMVNESRAAAQNGALLRRNYLKK